MDLQIRQKFEINKTAMKMSLLIMGSIFLVTLLTFLEKPGDKVLIFRTIMCMIMLGINIFGYNKYKETDKYKHFCNVTLFLSYILLVYTTKLFMYYAFIFPIAVIVMMFKDRTLVKVGVAAAVISNAIYDVMCVMNGVIGATEIIVQILLIGVMGFTEITICRVQNKHTDESVNEVQEKAAAAARVAEMAVTQSQNLSEQFDSAMVVSDRLTKAMDSSHDSLMDITESTKTTAEAIEKQTLMTADIQNSIDNVEAQTRTISELSDTTRKSVENGVQLVEKLKSQASEVAKISRETEVTTNNLNESIKEVEAITETILGISSKTNLLALNASIEAARAGEAGRGFAVVADEIRALSESTKSATEKISAIISKLTKDAEIASQSMSKSAEYADSQNELITETGETLRGINDNTESLYESVKEVAGAVENLMTANASITESISNISATSEEMAAASDTTLEMSDNSMDALKEMNGLLDNISKIAAEMKNISM